MILIGSATCPTNSGPAPIRFRSKYSFPEKVDGLLAAEKNISQSRIGNSVTRMQSISMLIGQAAGALAAIAVSQKVQPRQVDAGVVQRTLLDFNSALAKQDLVDLARNVDEWRAAEYSLVHRWLPQAAEGFAPQQTLTRAEAADALASAFRLLGPPTEIDHRWGYEPSPDATFKDVPLYHKYSPEIEALAQVRALRACAKSTDLFCPEDVETVGDFRSSLTILKSHAGGQTSGAVRQGDGYCPGAR